MENPTNKKDDSQLTLREQFLLAEFISLREEIQKNTELQIQLISLVLVIAGTIFSVGLQTNITPNILLIYPLLAVFLSAKSGQFSSLIFAKGAYIQQLEQSLNVNGWETHYKIIAKKNFDFSVGPFSTRGVFVFTQFIAIVLFLNRISFSALDVLQYILLSFSIISLIMTFWLLRSRKNILIKIN